MMKKFLSILITVLMIMQMFTFSVSSEETQYYTYWTGEGPGEIAFGTIEGMSYYSIKLYKDGKLVEETSHSVDGYQRLESEHNFLNEIIENGKGVYTAEVIYEDGISAQTGNYRYIAPSNSLEKPGYIEFNQEKNYIVWGEVADAALYEVKFVFSIDGGNSFCDMNAYLLEIEDGTYFDFWGNVEEQLKWIEESYQQAIIDHETTEENFIRAVQVAAYPIDLNKANPSYSDYVTFDGITIPDSGDDNLGDGSYSYMEIVDYQNEYYIGQGFYAELRLVYVSNDGTETYTMISSKECEVEGFDPYTPGWQEVTIWHGDEFVTCDVFVMETDVTVPHYQIRFDNAQIEYEYGEEFYVEVYEITADGQESRVYDYKVDGFDPYTPGWQVVTVAYGDYSQVFKAHVIDPEGEPEEPTICEIRFENAVTEYQLGEDFYVEAYLVDTEGNVYRTYAFEVDGFDSTRVGQQEVTVSFGDYSETYIVYVNEKSGADGFIGYIKASMPNVEFFPGDEFYAEVYIYTPDGSCYQIEDYKYEGFDSYTPGEQIVTIWYGNLSTTVTVWVYEEEPVEPAYTVSFENVKTRYEYSEEFYAEVWITDVNGEYYQADGWWVEGYDPCMPGWQTVTLRYGDYFGYYEVYVGKKESTDTTGHIEIIDYQREYYPGMEFYADLLVWEETEDGSMTSYSVNISDCIVEGFDSYMPGEQIVTIWYNNYRVDFCVTVYPEEPGPVYTVDFENVKTEYEYGEEFYIEVYRYIDGEKIALGNDEWWVEGYDPYMPGWQEVTVFCENRVETYEVYVNGGEYREVRFERVKKQYYEGEEIEAEVWFETADGRHEHTEDFQVEGYDAYFIGEQNITISFGGYSEDFTVTVKPRPIIDENVTHIRIKNLKTLYYLGEEFEAEVYAYTKDGNYYMVEDYLYYDFDSSIADEQQVTVRYGDFTDDCVVCVYENELTENLSGTCGDKLTWTLDTNGVLTISGTGAMTDYENTNGMPWYDNRGRIKEIIVKEGVTSIGKNAFAWSRSLESVVLPDTVTEINDYAFYACEILKNIIIPDSVTTIGSFAFCQCTRMEDVIFGGGLTLIEEDAFAHCISLTNVAIHSSIEMERCVFRYCESLENINVDDSNPYYCSIDGNLYDKNKTTLIQYAIGKRDTHYEIPYGVETIGEAAFDSCEKLTSINIPSTVTFIDEFAFRGCSNLIDVYYEGTVAQWNAITVNQYNDEFVNATIHFNENPEPSYSVTFENVKTEYAYGEEFYIEVYEYTAEGEKVAVEGWVVHRFDSTVPGEQRVTVTYGDYSATFTVYINDIENPAWWEYIPDTRELIIKGEMGSYGYDLNAGYTEAPWDYLRNEVEVITIWDGVTSITDGVFINFANLREVNLGSTVCKIGICAFERCTALEYIMMPDSVYYIAPRAFANSGLRAIDFGNGLTQIDSSVFQNCKFESISLPEGLRTIGINSFIGCRNLMKVYIPTSVKRIMSNAFNNCNMLTDVHYGGTQEEWDSITINDGNELLYNANIYFNGEEITKTISIENVKYEYAYGEEFYAEVWIETSDGNRWQTNEFEILNFDPYTLGWQEVIIRVEDRDELFEVYVGEQEYDEPYIVGVDFELHRTSYYIGEELDISVFVHTSDGECREVYDYEIEKFDGHQYGTQNITVRYGNFSQEFVIRVVGRPSTGGGGGGSDGTGPVITVSQEKCRVGNTVEVAVSIERNVGFANLGIEIEYDRALRLIDVIPNEDVGATFTPAQDYDVYPYNIDFTSTSNVHYDGELVKLVFEVPEGTPTGDYFVNVDFYKGREGNYIDGDNVNYDADENPLNLCYESGYVTVYDYIPGDINGNGVVDNKDGTALLRHLAGWTLEQIDYNALDVDGSGTVDNKDGTRLLRYLAGWDVEVY